MKRQEDLMRKLGEYSLFLEKEIKERTRLIFEENIYIRETAEIQGETYGNARDKLYELFPELIPKLESKKEKKK